MVASGPGVRGLRGQETEGGPGVGRLRTHHLWVPTALLSVSDSTLLPNTWVHGIPGGGRRHQAKRQETALCLAHSQAQISEEAQALAPVETSPF